MNEETRATETTEEWEDVTLEDSDLDETETVEEDAAEGSEQADQPEEETEGAGTEEPEQEAEGQADQFVLKHLDQVLTVSREEIVPLAQKGMDYDRIRQKLNEAVSEKAEVDHSLSLVSEIAKDSGFADVNAFLAELRAERLSAAEGIDITLARQRVSLDLKARELAEKESRLTAEKEAERETKDKEERRTREAAEFAREYPQVKAEEIPKEVWEAVNKGDTLVNAYRKHENAQLRAALAAREKEAENRAKSAGSRKSAQQPSRQDEIDRIWDSDD